MNVFIKHTKLFIVFWILHFIGFGLLAMCMQSCDGFGCLGCVAPAMPFMYTMAIFSTFNIRIDSGMLSIFLITLGTIIIHTIILYFILWLFDKMRNKKQT